ncbi:hypothetical protein ACLOJK_008010 [Asimina triloba]
MEGVDLLENRSPVKDVVGRCFVLHRSSLLVEISRSCNRPSSGSLVVAREDAPTATIVVAVTENGGDGLQSHRFWDPDLAAVLMGSSDQPIGALPAVISSAARKTMDLEIGPSLECSPPTIMAASLEEEDGAP